MKNKIILRLTILLLASIGMSVSVLAASDLKAVQPIMPDKPVCAIVSLENGKSRAADIEPTDTCVQFRLASNPTTGYTWYLLRYDTNLLKFKSYHYVLPHNKLIGAPGTAVFTFDILPALHEVPQLAYVFFTYARVFDLTSAQQTVFALASSGTEKIVDQHTSAVKKTDTWPLSPASKHQIIADAHSADKEAADIAVVPYETGE